MKKQLHLKLFSLLFLVTSVVSAQFTVGNLTYTITSGTNVSVKTTNISISGDLTIPNTVSNSGTTYTVTSIGHQAFTYCSSLTSVTIPDTVTSIGVQAFAYCSSLTSVTIPDAVTTIGDWAFQNCSGLKSVIIPDAVTSIREGAFQKCSDLTTLSIPNSVTSIGDYAFLNCTGLTAVNVSWATPLAVNSTVFQGVSVSNVTLNVSTPGVVSDFKVANVWEDFYYDASLSTNSYQANSTVKLYPNPAKDYFSISGLLEQKNYIIYNASGAKVNTGSVSSNEKIDIQNLANGTYFLKLENGNSIQFIKQ